MTAAAGIHAHPSMKLGLKPSDPDRPVLRLAEFLTGVVPAHPTSVDHAEGVTPGLYMNDRFGVCGPTMVCNDRRLITTRAGVYQEPSLQDCYDLYRASGNPRFDPITGEDDNGVDLKTMLGACVKVGVGDGQGGKVQALGYAAVDATNRDELQAAIDIFGSVHLAVDLETAQQEQSQAATPTWDYAASADWGGHAILGVSYTPDEDGVWSWAELIRMTHAFEERQLQEAYVVIWPEHDTNPGLYEALDMPAFAEAYRAITNGRRYPGHVTPNPGPDPRPAPTPAPNPMPGGGAPFQLSDAVAKELLERAARQRVSTSAWLEHHLRVQFGMRRDQDPQPPN